MKKTPKSLRLHIGLFGRTNSGKSSFLNLLVGQDIAITSPVPGTTTDVVEKPMELLPIGPVVFLDTAGLDDVSELGRLRVDRTRRALERSDAAVLVVEPEVWTEHEDFIVSAAAQRKIPLVAAVNKADLKTPSDDFLRMLRGKGMGVFVCSSMARGNRDKYLTEFKKLLLERCPDDFLNPPPLLGDLLPPGGVCVLMIPIDSGAPKGRLILPEAQSVRDTIDHGAACVVTRETEYAETLAKFRKTPDLAVCDSQVVDKMVQLTPPEMRCTTFSILFARLKGDLTAMCASARAIGGLRPGDRVLIAEACAHHPAHDDIGRVKLPRWLAKQAGGELKIDFSGGRDFPENLRDYKVIIHCGACMLTRRDMLYKLQRAAEAGVPMTNYGVAISYMQGVLERVLEPFPAALEAYKKAK